MGVALACGNLKRNSVNSAPFTAQDAKSFISLLLFASTISAQSIKAIFESASNSLLFPTLPLTENRFRLFYSYFGAVDMKKVTNILHQACVAAIHAGSIVEMISKIALSGVCRANPKAHLVFCAI